MTEHCRQNKTSGEDKSDSIRSIQAALASAPLYTAERSQLLQGISNQIRSSIKDRHDRHLRGLLLVSGASGTGKTFLVRSVKEHFCHEYNGIFWEGKVDQIQHSNPFVEIFSHLGEILLHDDFEEHSGRLRDTIQEELGPMYLRMFVKMVPALEGMFDEALSRTGVCAALDDEARETGIAASSSRERLPLVLCHVLRLICRPERPLLLFVDDLQWAKEATFQTLTAILSSDEIQEGRLVVVAACREVVGNDHALVQYLRHLDEKGCAIEDIVLSNFSMLEVNRHMSLTLNCREEATTPLSEVMHIYTGGNNFYIHRIMSLLLEEKLIFRTDSTDEWDWDLIRIRERLQCSDVLQFERERLLRRSPSLQMLLQVASCLGASFEFPLLEAALPQDIASCAQQLTLEAQDKQLFVRRDMSWSFLHDRIQQAAYGLIDSSCQQSFHLAIGERLLRRLTPQEVEMHLLLIASQVLRGVEQIGGAKERSDAAVLFLKAGKKASGGSHFEEASQFLNQAMALLPDDHWTHHYELSLELFNAMAEVEYIRGNFGRLDLLIQQSLKHARVFDDKLQSYTTKIYAMGTQNKLEEAIEEALYVLRELGEPLPKFVNKAQVAFEYRQTDSGTVGQFMDRNRSLVGLLGICKAESGFVFSEESSFAA